MRAFSSFRRPKVLVALGLAGTLIVAGQLLWSRTAQLDAAIDRSREELGRLRELIEARAADAATTAAHEQAADAAFVEAANAHLAAAGLQARVVDIVAREGAAVRRVSVDEPDDPTAELRLSVALSGPYDAILRVIDAIETSPPAMLLHSLELRALERPGDAAEDIVIDAELGIVAFHRETQP